MTGGLSCIRPLVVLLAVCALQAGPAQAADPAEPAPSAAPAAAAASPGWSFTVMPYIWAAGMSGTIRPFAAGPGLSFDQSFSDILEDLDGAFFLSFGAERGRFVMLGDISRVETSRDGLLPGGIPAEGSTEQTMFSLAAGYRAVAEPRLLVDVFAGFRAIELEADVQVLGGALSASPERSILDPLIGARAQFALSPRWSATIHGDVGGFGAGTESTVVASALLSYRLNDNVAFSGGYRSMWIDYDDDGTLADVTIAGPVLGISFRY